MDKQKQIEENEHSSFLMCENYDAYLESMSKTELLEYFHFVTGNYRHSLDKITLVNIELQEQVEELKERKEFWEGMHDRVCLKLEEYDDKSEEYENALTIKQYRITELQKQVDELKRENAKVISFNDALYREKEQAVKDTAKEILDELDLFFKGTTFRKGYEFKKIDEKLKEIAKRKGVEVE